jgi:predicted PurR-regulated permease PerM
MFNGLNWKTLIFILILLIILILILKGYFPSSSEDILKLILGNNKSNLSTIADFLKEIQGENKLNHEQILNLIDSILKNQTILNASITFVTNILLQSSKKDFINFLKYKSD